MKKLLIALIAVACATLVPVSSALAYYPGQTRVVSSCGRCGSTVYQRYQVLGYAYDGCPRYGWATVGHRCVSSHHHHGHHHHASRSHHHHSKKHHHHSKKHHHHRR